MLVIGLTGGIGTGKSTVSAMLAEHGAVILNADLVGHEAYLPHKHVWGQVVSAFGPGILTEHEEVDRRKLGAMVFADPEAMQRLNSIVHPWIYARMAELLDELRAKGTRVAVLEAALLIEAQWFPLVDQVWVLTAPEAAVIERLQARNGLTLEQIQDRIRAQMSPEQRATYADVILETGGTIDDVKARLHELWQTKVHALVKE